MSYGYIHALQEKKERTYYLESYQLNAIQKLFLDTD
jgi:hypothetical protein